MNRVLKIFILISLVCFLSIHQTNATDDISSPVQLKAEADIANLDMLVKDNFIKTKLISAENRFLQGNVIASHQDFEDLISKTSHDDYVFMGYAMKMSEFGFFDLSEDLIRRLDNNLYTKNYVKEVRKFYYPSGMLNEKDILYLADAYAGIVYNNLAMETTSELLNSVQANESDYKNYLISLGYYKSNNLNKALKYINMAITENSENVNYKILKARILADAGKAKQALKVVAKINKSEFYTCEFQDKVKATEEYVKYKVEKEPAVKDYHLSYYYHLQDKSLLATKVLQSAIIPAKDFAPNIFALLGRIYYENDDMVKATEFTQRAYKDDNKNYLASLTMADLSYYENKYNEALKYYKNAKKLSKSTLPSVGIAKTYLAMEKEKKSKKIYEKLLNKQFYDKDVLMGAAATFPQKSYDYLPAIVSVDLTNTNIWLELARLAIVDNNYSMAETYLNNSYYIDENNFKYYYYLSQVLRAKGDYNGADNSLAKCNKLNSDYEKSISNLRQNVYEK
ncbi:MAG: hypothetical protein MJ237_02830 [bacterium]|nr:hypothetical protein [bacterium]